MRSSGVLMVVTMAALLLFATAPPAPAIDLGDAIKVFGIGYAVRVFGSQINSFVNTLLAQRGVEWEGTTKVVPIISIGSGTYIGAAQVAGPPSLVDRVRAVAQGEIRFGDDFRGKALIPVSTTNVLRGVRRIEGVGLSALIDFRV
ncbi:MAG: hypothetical protein HYX78_00245 [Armatimonadetes bacterium]|nr:hypothetical protein [Armatimonadota bacterium]